MTISKLLCTTGLLSATLWACMHSWQAVETPIPEALHNPVIEEHAVAERQPLVQIAILLDNSGSMSGLIDQARTQIWSLVNEFIHAKRGEKRPQLQVSIVTYGDPPPKLLVNLSNDLDKVSEALFGIAISGGSEYCGQVINYAVENLAWSDHRDDLKIIFIAGNEEFTQGPIDYRSSCKAAINKGIIVNTIHCGNGIPAGWADGAALADGKAMSIDHNQQQVAIATPYDKEIAELNTQMNRTYVAYGKAGKKRKSDQTMQDSNAGSLSQEAFVQRAVAKSNHLYCNDSWDIVDACKNDFKVLDKLEEADLPESLQGKDRAEQEAHIKTLRQQRTDIQQQINDLNTKRQSFITEKQKETQPEDKSLQQAMKKAVYEQAQQKAIEFKK